MLKLKKNDNGDVETIKRMEALRETHINALCHRWWEQHNLTISLAIYYDRIEIASPGQFPRQITPENIKQPHESFPHNLNVAEALFRMTYLENWGSGAKRIIDACRAQNVEEPTWSDHGGFITVTFKRPSKQDLEDHDPQNGGNMIKSRPEKRNSSPDSSPVVLAGTLEFINSSSEIKVLMLLKFYPTLTLEKVAILMNMTKRGVIKITNKLQENGKLSRKGANKNGEWIVND